MITQEQFAVAFRQMSSLDWSPIPAVITGYDASQQKASVRPLIKKIMRDKTTLEYSTIHGVPVMTPRTASAGLQLPVTIGDKVTLIFMHKSIEELLYTDLSGKEIIPSTDPKDTRLKDYNDCIAFVGFNDFGSAIGTDDSANLKNNIGKGTWNRISLNGDGSITADNENGSIQMSAEGTTTITAGASVITVGVDGVVSIEATEVVLTAPEVTCTGTVTAVDFISTTGVSLINHFHELAGAPTTPSKPTE